MPDFHLYGVQSPTAQNTLQVKINFWLRLFNIGFILIIHSIYSWIILGQSENWESTYVK